MALCSVDYVRSKISTIQTDEILSNLIDETTEDVLAQCETTDESNPLIILAGKYAALASLLRYMKTTGELAASIETPGSKMQNTTDIDIARYDQKSEGYIQQFRAANSFTYSNPSYNVGFTSHNTCRWG